MKHKKWSYPRYIHCMNCEYNLMMLDDRPVVTMWMAELKGIVHVDQQFSVMVRKMKIGKACKRDFMKPGCTVVYMVTGKTL